MIESGQAGTGVVRTWPSVDVLPRPSTSVRRLGPSQSQSEPLCADSRGLLFVRPASPHNVLAVCRRADVDFECWMLI